MRITQEDFRTVRIDADGLTALLRYSLYQNGDERLPESIACRDEQVVAYFLTSTIRDFISRQEGGFSVQRTWTVLQEGRFGLSFCLEFPELTGASYLFPGVARGDAAPLQPEPTDGSLTALPGAVYLLSGRRSALVFADPPRSPLDRGSVEVSRLAEEEVPRVRVELRYPPRAASAVQPGPLPRAKSRPPSGRQAGRKTEAGDEPALAVKGSFEHSARLNVIVGSDEELYGQGAAAALSRLAAAAPPASSAPSGSAGAAAPSAPSAALTASSLRARTREEIADCQESLLVRDGGVCGLRLGPGVEMLTATAGAGLAALLLRLFPGEEPMEELAMQLADFALRAQHPGGLFYERYHLQRRSWLEPDGKKERAPAVLPGETADTAYALLTLVGLLRRRGLPHARYLHAASRAVTALADSARREPDAEEAWLALPEPLVELFLLTGKDAHKKTLSGIKERLFGGQAQPAVPDSVQASILRARAAVALAGAGFAVKGLEACFRQLLPWVYLNRRPGEREPEPCGGLLECLGGHRLLFRGFELAHLLARLSALHPLGVPPLRSLLQQVMGFTLRQPAGLSFISLVHPEGSALGPLDSRILVRELTARTRMLEEFPQYFRKGR